MQKVTICVFSLRYAKFCEFSAGERDHFTKWTAWICSNGILKFLKTFFSINTLDFGVEWATLNLSVAHDLQKSQKMGLTKIVEFRIIAMADHYDQKCHVLILFKNKIINKKLGLYTTRIDNHLSIENGFSTHVSTHLSRRPRAASIACLCDKNLWIYWSWWGFVYKVFFFLRGWISTFRLRDGRSWQRTVRRFGRFTSASWLGLHV